MGRREDLLVKIRRRFARVQTLADTLTPEIEALIEEYLELLRPVLGADLDDPIVLAELTLEVAQLALETVLTDTQMLNRAQAALNEDVIETNPAGFLYVGPDEDVIVSPGGYRLPRPFCDQLVGRWLTLEEIRQLNNRQIPNAMVSRGGYNCRHQWHAIYGTEVDEFEKADVGRANAAAGRRR